MSQKDLQASVSFTPLQVDCPACPGRFELLELIRLEKVRCARCGNDSRVRAQDVPGRVLVDLLPQN